MRLKLPRSFYIPKNAVAVPAPEGVNAEAYVYPANAPKFCALVFSGKRTKPDVHYSFKDEAAARKYIADRFVGYLSAAVQRAEWAAKRKAEKCLTVADVYAKALKDGYLSAAETAICLRAALVQKFPGVKFSVRSDIYSGGCSISVSWVDGPRQKDVDAVCDNYEFAGFDGMIDLKYNKSRWLAPDGTMSLARSQGTESSRGQHGEVIGDPHAPQVALVRGGADWIHANKSFSLGAKRKLAETIAKRHAISLPANDGDLERFLNTTQVNGDYLCSLVRREAGES